METARDSRSEATSGCPFRHDPIDSTDSIKLRGFMKFVSIALAQVLLDIIGAGGLEEDQNAAAKTAAHHPCADHLRHPGGELHEAVKLPAAYREIEAKTLMRPVEDWAQAARRPAAQGVRRPQHPSILGNDVAGAAPFNPVGDPVQARRRCLPEAGGVPRPAARPAPGSQRGLAR